MKTDIQRLIAVQEAQLAHARWLAGLQASPFTPPELDADKAAVVARQLNPQELAPGMQPEDYGMSDPIRVCSPSVSMHKIVARWDSHGMPGWRASAG